MTADELQKSYDLALNTHNNKFGKGVTSEEAYQDSCNKLFSLYDQLCEAKAANGEFLPVMLRPKKR